MRTFRVGNIYSVTAILVLVIGVLYAYNSSNNNIFTEANTTSTVATLVGPLQRASTFFNSITSRYLSRSLLSTSNSNNTATHITTRTTTTVTMKRTPVYFVSHGGPSTMYDRNHPVFARLQAVGQEITTRVKPSAILVFSAHWQATRPGTIEINTSEEEPLLYDFYGFPRHYYAEKYPNRGSLALASRVGQLLNEAGIPTVETERGLDHGVFVPFKVMFDPATNPLAVPVVQASLFDDDTDARAHLALGRAVRRLRDENVLVVVSGMAVHNLRHLGLTMGTGRTMPYAVSFDAALTAAVETAPGDARDRAMCALLDRPDARAAHPTFEHLLPAHVGVGAAGDDPGKLLWTLPEGSMSWAQYRFGEVEA